QRTQPPHQPRRGGGRAAPTPRPPGFCWAGGGAGGGPPMGFFFPRGWPPRGRTGRGGKPTPPSRGAAFLLSRSRAEGGQHQRAPRQFVPVSRTIETPLNKGPLQIIDSAAILDQARKWQDLYQRTIIAASR